MTQKEILLRSKYIFKSCVGDAFFYTLRDALSKYTTEKVPLKLYGKPQYNGVNLVGPLSTIGGLGSAARSLSDSIKAANIRINEIEFNKNLMKKTRKETQKHISNKYFVNLICANADQTTQIVHKLGNNFFKHRYTIGYWLWEQEEFPNYWKENFDLYDEIWTSSTFSQKAIQKCTQKPVLVIPLSINPKATKKYRLSDFGIKKDDFVFLFVFDFLSGFERKNPLSLIKAFTTASKDMPYAKLIMKTTNSEYDSKNLKKMKRAALGKNIHIIDSCLSTQKLYSLYQACDCYVSLHRTEGFGYTIFEAMYFGKPVIATGYSGVCDFINKTNSYPVKYTKQKLVHTYGAYKKDTFWAEPDTKDAAQCMIKIYKDSMKSVDKGKKGKQMVHKALSPQTVGKTISQRFATIQKNYV